MIKFAAGIAIFYAIAFLLMRWSKAKKSRGDAALNLQAYVQGEISKAFSGNEPLPYLVTDQEGYNRHLKAATQHKKAGRFDEAISELKSAYDLAGGAPLVKDHLRLPMYLQLAGRADEGWSALNQIMLAHTDTGAQREIADQARIFLEKEGRLTEALKWSAWHYCMSVHHARWALLISERLKSDQPALQPLGPVEDFWQKERDRLLTIESARSFVEKLLRQIGRAELIDDMAMGILVYAKFNDPPSLHDLSAIISSELWPQGAKN